MRALRGIQPLYHMTFSYESYNFMGVPDFRIILWASPISEGSERRSSYDEVRNADYAICV